MKRQGRTKRRRGYAAKRERSERMYAPCGSGGKNVTDQQTADTKYWVAKIRSHMQYGSNEAVTLEMIQRAKELQKERNQRQQQAA